MNPEFSKTRTLLGIEREDLSGATQRERAKKNIRYDIDGKRMVAKYVDRLLVGTNNIARLLREKALLEKVSETSLVPKVLDFKMYGTKRARLLLEEVPGTSIDRMDRVYRQKFVQEHAQDIVQESAKALQRLRDLHVYVVDVNQGTFLYDERADGSLETRVVDFELGYDADTKDPKNLHGSLSFLARGDFGFSLANLEGKHIEETESTLAKAEMHQWGLMIYTTCIQKFGSVTIPPEQREAYAEFRARIAPLVDTELRSRAEQAFERKFSSVSPEQRERDAEKITAGKDAFVASYLKSMREAAMLYECRSFTFPSDCVRNDIHLSPVQIQFIQRCLSADVHARPEDFHDLLG